MIMKKVSWVLENNGKRTTVATTDKDGHTAYKAWQLGCVFFQGAPAFSEFKVTRLDKVPQ